MSPFWHLLKDILQRTSVFRSQGKADSRGPTDHNYWGSVNLQLLMLKRRKGQHDLDIDDAASESDDDEDD
ncbi:hypothetical protein WJX73_007748 [Symbiochloris irregularis]|uniref:Uncharacterized protein n=1 Tax=Symbiochloris irregularis TaxID=706552 RepID=A0AAW1NM16_9CHLO